MRRALELVVFAGETLAAASTIVPNLLARVRLRTIQGSHHRT